MGAAYEGVVTTAEAEGFECVGVLVVVGGDTARKRSGDTSPEGERRVALPAARRFNDADNDVPAGYPTLTKAMGLFLWRTSLRNAFRSG